MMLPKDCRGHYVPWICGFCKHLHGCTMLRRGTRR